MTQVTSWVHRSTYSHGKKQKTEKKLEFEKNFSEKEKNYV